MMLQGQHPLRLVPVLLALSCFVGCWEEIHYEPGQSAVPAEAPNAESDTQSEPANQVSTNSSEPSPEPSNVAPEVVRYPDHTAAETLPPELPPRRVEPKEEELAQEEPEPAEVLSNELETPEPTTVELVSEEPKAEEPVVQPPVVEEVEEVVVEEVVTNPLPARGAIGDQETQRVAQETAVPEVEEESDELHDEDDDIFTLFDTEEPAEEPKKAKQTKQPTEKVPAEIDLLFGDTTETAALTKADPAPPATWELPTKEEKPAEPDESMKDGPTKNETVKNETVKIEDPSNPQETAPPAKPADQALEEPQVPEVDRAAVWQASGRWSMALALRAKGTNPTRYEPALKQATEAANKLGVKLPAMPTVESEELAVSAIQAAMLNEQGPDLWQAIDKQLGVAAGNLAELAVRTHRLLLTYSPSLPHFSGEAEEMKRLAESAELPEKLWQPLIQLLENRGSFSEVKSAIFNLHREVAKHLAE